MNLASSAPRQRLFVVSLLSTTGKVPSNGQGLAGNQAIVTLGDRVALINAIGSHASTIFFQSLNRTFLTIGSLIALSSIVSVMVTRNLTRNLIASESEYGTSTSTSKMRQRAFMALAGSGCVVWLILLSTVALSSPIEIWGSFLVIVSLTILVTVTTKYPTTMRKKQHFSEGAPINDAAGLYPADSIAGSYSTTLDGLVLNCNTSFCTILGYSAPEELIGKPVNAVHVDPNDWGSFIQRLISGKVPVNLKQRLRRTDGTVVWVLNCASLEAGDDASVPVIQGTIVCISEIGTTAQEHRRLAAIVRCSHDAIVSLSVEGIIKTWNGGAEQLFGYTAAEAVGQPMDILAPSDRSEECRQILVKVRESTGVQDIDTIRKRKDGQRIAVSISVSPIEDATGHVIGAAAILRDISSRKAAEEALRESEAHYRNLFDSTPFPMWVLDRSTLRVLAVNRSAIREYSYSECEFLKMTFADMHPAEEIHNPSKNIGTVNDALVQAGLWKHRKKCGAIIDVEVVCDELNFHGVDAILIAAHDITERKHAEEALLFKTALLEAQSETTLDGILVVDESEHIVLVNRHFGSQFEVPDELLKSGDGRIVRQYVADKVEDSTAFIERVHYLYSHREDKARDEIRLKSGKIFERYTAPLVDSKDTYRGRIWYFRDVTDRKAAEARIQFLAYFDALTGLPNRALLKDRTEKALAGARRRNERIAILFLDLDQFKHINESLGHALGDLLLQGVAERLKGCTRAQDTLARVGSDEFAIVLCGVKDADQVKITAERLVKSMTARFMIRDHSLSASCSLGISMYPDHGQDVETLLKFADQAMYYAKENGRNSFRFFNEDMNIQVMERSRLETDLYLALEREEFFLVYQPQIEITSGRITGMESLIRWRHPESGLIPPSSFIPIAEKKGLILPIGEWGLAAACAQAQRWHKDGLLKVPVAVNVSAVQFRQQGFCEMIRRILHETGLPPHFLELELTESLLVSNEDVMFSVLQELKNMGLTLAIDDFGTGYSSLSYLRQFPVHKLKIDRSFIREIPMDPGDAAITTAIIRMAKSLNLRVIAEGVENEAQVSFLREHRCDEIQGYLFSRPITAAEVADKLRYEWVQHDGTTTNTFQ